MIKLNTIGFVIISFLIGQCQNRRSQPVEENNIVQLQNVPYNIHQMDHLLVLPRELVEVSGLAYNIHESTLMLVNDELGYIYELDKDDGSILTKKKFADFGDYEGIEYMNSDLIVSRSNGKIYFYNQENENTYKIVKTNINVRNNIEGITYDSSKNQILLACKGVPEVTGLIEETKGKLICVYDIESENVLPEPYILIKDKQLRRKVDEIYKDVGLTENQLAQLKDRVEGFAPSGLAIHPHSGHVYILSAQKSLLVVINSVKEIQHIHFLDQDLHVQPEGICFTPKGDMYISNEGKHNSAKIYLYKYQN